ncbi:MAG: hypothetical protein HKN32_01975 [Flavobacteriales bacterium]|nr:hypothetical protein [Flavobacteriales bacterium]
MKLLLLFFLLAIPAVSYGSGIGDVHRQELEQLILSEIIAADESPRKENPRLVGMALTVLIGPFGGHRIYYGTSAKVPIFYALTLGGGLGILPLIDLLVVAFSKDLTPYFNNDRIFMWGGE